MLKAESVDAYFARLPPEQRRALEDLRRQVLAAAPGAHEVISYGLPTFKLRPGPGMGLVAIGAAKAHLSLYPMSESVIARYADELKGFSTSKGTVRFTPERPIPPAVVAGIVRDRIAAAEAADAARQAKKAAKRR